MQNPEPAPPGSAAARNEGTLREIALAYPESYEEFPWGHRAFKVRKKVFVFLACDVDGLRLSLKLPHSNHEALMLPFTEPTHYGLGKSGWVTATFGPEDEPPLWILRDWIEESFRAVAPKKVVALLEGEAVRGASGKKASRKARPTMAGAKKAKKSTKKAVKKPATGRKASKRKAGAKKTARKKT